MSAPSPVTSMQTPQREFAGAKVLLFFELTKCFMIFLQWGIVFLFYTVEPSALCKISFVARNGQGLET